MIFMSWNNMITFGELKEANILKIDLGFRFNKIIIELMKHFVFSYIDIAIDSIIY